ncbi:hypothetical protein [Azospirillum sp. TSO5]|uniref:hypothetical protein n=1 Tax=Azospirillum sp. TSO5 TaxID=716760 RepID=UPI000D60E4EA|nr:hypothetical protein [Azospirillum sp. TSO5]PWC96982.1 hypothetical protein TSO5_06010 [Azospirillum sp. TSO5]
MKVASARAKLRKITGSQHSSIMEIRGGVMFCAESPFSVSFARSGRTVQSQARVNGGHELVVKAQLTDALIADIAS